MVDRYDAGSGLRAADLAQGAPVGVGPWGEGDPRGPGREDRHTVHFGHAEMCTEVGAGLHRRCVVQQAYNELVSEAYLTGGARGLNGSEERGRVGERLGGGDKRRGRTIVRHGG